MSSPHRIHRPPGLAQLAPGPRLGVLLEGIDPALLTAEDTAVLLVAWQRQVASMRRHVQTRDRRCGFPGCRMPARSTDTDHIRPWLLHGPTQDHNLTSLCRHDHRLKDRHSWQLSRRSNGTLRWTSPLGLTYTIRRPPIIVPLPHLPGRPATSTDTERIDQGEIGSTEIGSERRNEHTGEGPSEQRQDGHGDFPLWWEPAGSAGRRNGTGAREPLQGGRQNINDIGNTEGETRAPPLIDDQAPPF